jgi:hypothetical protein
MLGSQAEGGSDGERRAGEPVEVAYRDAVDNIVFLKRQSYVQASEDLGVGGFSRAKNPPTCR